MEELANSIINARKNIKECVICHNYTESDKCNICANSNRTENLICVVEKPADIFLIEKPGSFQGTYHVLGGSISPLDGIGPDELNITSLLNRLKNLSSPEIILALNTSSDGEATVMYLMKCLKEIPVTMSRLARGIPIGSNLQYVDERTMQKSLENRVPL